MIDISSLNEAQQSAVTASDRSTLVIAGAGSGKTRTLVYRLAWLIEQGIPLAHMLLLTFTRKAATQMLERASIISEHDMRGMKSGTFHAFAFSVLRMHQQFCLRHADNKSGYITVMDSSDQNSCIAACKDEHKIAKGDRSFPKSPAVISLISKSRNKELSIEEILKKEAQHLIPYTDELQKLAIQYQLYKQKHGLFDYDDLLFELENLFIEQAHTLEYYQSCYPYVMVDEYQDTNKVQARLIKHLAGERGNIMAVGDDAQSIYAFRGATVRNILDFPKLFPDTRIIYLEENYRSVQPVLDVANRILSQATEGYAKHLFSKKDLGSGLSFPVRMYRPLSDVSQAKLACRRIQEHLLTSKPSEIAVLFRSGYQSYHLEVELNRNGIDYKKYGGIKYTEAAHVKDLLAYTRLIMNPQDLPSFERIASFAKGVGAKTAQKLYHLSQSGETEKFAKQLEKYLEFKKDIELINHLRTRYLTESAENRISVTSLLNILLDRYKEHAPNVYPDDYPRRIIALEEVITIAIEYNDLDLFISDLILDISDEEETDHEKIVLSTVHSAKGLEWDKVLVMDLVEDRFPSRHSLARAEEFEEERRLLYVACTRAKDNLDLFVPLSLYQRASQSFESAMPSPFIRTLETSSYDEYTEEIGGGVYKKIKNSSNYANPLEDSKKQASSFSPSRFSPPPSSRNDFSSHEKTEYKDLGFCKHKIFGRGKIVSEIDGDKYKINFPNIGLKTILKSFVTLENN